MAATRGLRSIYTSPLLWGLILLATAAVIVTRGLWSGAAVFGSAAAGVVLITTALVVVDRIDRKPEYDNKLDPWDE
ncbi:hypothetical protein BRC91_02150 [Halobacteriales archaeon QS_4_62_28]|nr:MAG: hypothetical protein BRC91_02150 [Halobacteriales archaeon QS_4_62_28]